MGVNFQLSTRKARSAFFGRRRFERGGLARVAALLPQSKARSRGCVSEEQRLRRESTNTPTRGRGDRASRDRASWRSASLPSKLAKTRAKTLRLLTNLPSGTFWGQEGFSEDLSLWLRWETEAAERGCVDAQFALGYACLQGLQVDRAMAFAWFRKAALQGRPYTASPPFSA